MGAVLAATLLPCMSTTIDLLPPAVLAIPASVLPLLGAVSPTVVVGAGVMSTPGINKGNSRYYGII